MSVANGSTYVIRLQRY